MATWPRSFFMMWFLSFVDLLFFSYCTLHGFLPLPKKKTDENIGQNTISKTGAKIVGAVLRLLLRSMITVNPPFKIILLIISAAARKCKFFLFQSPPNSTLCIRRYCTKRHLRQQADSPPYISRQLLSAIFIQKYTNRILYPAALQRRHVKMGRKRLQCGPFIVK